MSRLFKRLPFLLLAMILVLAACAAPAGDSAGDAGEPAAEADLEGVPEIFTGEQLKIAVVRNLPSDDHTKQFLDGARREGEAFGFVVDTFIADNDDAKFQELVAQAVIKGYDGMIISHGKQDY